MIVGLEIDFVMSISPLRWIALGAALAAIPAACKSPEFKYDSTTGGQGGSLSSSSSGAAGNAGTGGLSSSSSSSSSSSTSSSSSGMPAMCRPLHDAEDCGADKRCTVKDENNGDTHCVAIQTPTKKKYEACLDDDSCPAGTWCDWRNDVCAPFCDDASDCVSVGGGDCVAAKGKSGKVPAITICTANCDPAGLTSCGPGAACNYDNFLGSLDCFYSQKKGYGETCVFADCAPTLVCAGTCEYWCHPTNSLSDDCLGGYCQQDSGLTPTYNGEIYGFCL